MARTIVVGYDWSPHGRRALERAREYAPDGSTVVVVSVAPTEPTPADILIQKQALDEAEKELAGGAIKIEVVAASGDASGSIVDSARDADADLVVVGSRGRIKGKLVAAGTCPAFLSSGSFLPEKRSGSRASSKAICPVSRSETSSSALNQRLSSLAG